MAIAEVSCDRCRLGLSLLCSKIYPTIIPSQASQKVYPLFLYLFPNHLLYYSESVKNIMSKMHIQLFRN